MIIIAFVSPRMSTYCLIKDATWGVQRGKGYYPICPSLTRSVMNTIESDLVTQPGRCQDHPYAHLCILTCIFKIPDILFMQALADFFGSKSMPRG